MFISELRALEKNCHTPAASNITGGYTVFLPKDLR